MPIEADRNDYRRGYRKHYQAYKFLSKTNDCSISRRLLLVYCVECGLKYRLLKSGGRIVAKQYRMRKITIS